VHRYSLSHLSNADLLREINGQLGTERRAVAMFVACLAEILERRLFASAGYESTYAWCRGELRLAEETACRRIRVARVARRFPVIYPMLAEGRLNVTAVALLEPYLDDGNAEELLAAAVHAGRAEVEALIAARFPRPDLPALLEPVAAQPANILPPLVGVSNWLWTTDCW
jgi:hypothetical protein